MKYRIGERIISLELLKLGWNKGAEPDCEIVCLGVFGDGVWKYGVLEDMAEYGNMIDFYTEEEFERKFVIGNEK